MKNGEFLKMAIFDPLGMKNTWTATDPSDSIEINGTTGYDRGRPVPKDFFDGVVGDKGIYSTVEDLFIWYKALNSECLLTRRSEEHTSELQSLMRISYAVFCLKQKKQKNRSKSNKINPQIRHTVGK